MGKTLFEQRIEYHNQERLRTKSNEPEFGFTFVGETSKEAEIELQAKFLMALLDIDYLRVFK